MANNWYAKTKYGELEFDKCLINENYKVPPRLRDDREQIDYASWVTYIGWPTLS
jgi:hypothetical protein